MRTARLIVTAIATSRYYARFNFSGLIPYETDLRYSVPGASLGLYLLTLILAHFRGSWLLVRNMNEILTPVPYLCSFCFYMVESSIFSHF